MSRPRISIISSSRSTKAPLRSGDGGEGSRHRKEDIDSLCVRSAHIINQKEISVISFVLGGVRGSVRPLPYALERRRRGWLGVAMHVWRARSQCPLEAIVDGPWPVSYRLFSLHVINGMRIRHPARPSKTQFIAARSPIISEKI